MKGKHLVFYDGTCGFCDQIVNFLLNQDVDELFLFAPLNGTTAARYLNQIASIVKEADSLVLIENFQTQQPIIFIYGKAALRICWLLKGKWRLIGWVSFLPPFLYDWAYRLVARNRHRFF